MREYTLQLGGVVVPVFEVETLVVGTGCAGYNAADWLYDLGKRDVVMVTEGVNIGTSRNTGSDKQTYYKLSASGDQPDSVQEMAETLFSGGGVHGDIALAEAACSSKCFYKLVNLGVPFPCNNYGEYVGYKTDHDPRQRATSAGPLTSKYMTECLERSVKNKNVAIHDGIELIRLLVEGNRLLGAIGVCKDRAVNPYGFVLYRCSNLIAATGGPADVYYTSVYPPCHTGMTGMLLEAGARASNLQEWQYGLASVRFRWNVSGTYQQVLPRYLSVGPDGEEVELLPQYFSDPFQAVNLEFLKGYQWPFDSGRLSGSSSLDVIVYHEIFRKGRRVYMDFTRNPSCIDEYGFGPLSEEARTYLNNSGALFGTPIDRLRHMNCSAIDLYASHGIDLAVEPLEISICAQHCNGGIEVDSHWQTSVRGLYAAGEAAGTFGSHRPGGAALNSCQVGSMRAAESIAYSPAPEEIPPVIFESAAQKAVIRLVSEAECVLSASGKSTVAARILAAQKRMSACAAQLRDEGAMAEAEARFLEELSETASIGNLNELPLYFKYRDMLKSQLGVLSAARLSAKVYGSRGSCMVKDEAGLPVSDALPDYRYRPFCETEKNTVVITEAAGSGFRSYLVEARPIPSRSTWFENVWQEYRKRCHN